VDTATILPYGAALGKGLSYPTVRIVFRSLAPMGKPTRFGERLRDLRKQRGLNQDQLAKKAGISKSGLVKFETGQRKEAAMSTARALAKALQVSLSALGWEPDPRTEERLRDYLKSVYAKTLEEEGHPVTPEEKDWLRFVIESLWLEGTPRPKTLDGLLRTYRDSPDLRRG
jgi:transcriptional regulator with XRE-family HTH domain